VCRNLRRLHFSRCIFSVLIKLCLTILMDINIMEVLPKYGIFFLKYSTFTYLFPVVQQPKSGLDHLICEVSRSHTIRHTLTVGLLWTSDNLVKAATHTTHNKHTRITILSARFELLIQTVEWLQIYALDVTAIGITYMYIVYITGLLSARKTQK
jgi:hypothetical protein